MGWKSTANKAVSAELAILAQRLANTGVAQIRCDCKSRETRCNLEEQTRLQFGLCEQMNRRAIEKILLVIAALGLLTRLVLAAMSVGSYDAVLWK